MPRTATLRRALALAACGAGLLLCAPAAGATPHAAFTSSAPAPETGQTVQFADASTDDTGTIDSYRWSVDGDYAGDERELTYSFDTPGAHDVSLTVSDENYDDDTATVSVTVVQAPSERLSSGAVEARLFYGAEEDNFQPVRLQVLRSGQAMYEREIPQRCNGQCPIFPFGAYGSGSSLRLADFNRDSEPEVVFDFGWGNICCRATTVLTLDGGRYVEHTHNWGNSGPGDLSDFNHDGRLVWRSSDGRIRYAFGCGGCVPYPVQVVAYKDGRFVDVTKSYPRLVRADARAMWRIYRKHQAESARGALAAWAADQLRLGRRALVWRTVRSAVRAGRLHRDGDYDVWPHDRGFERALRRWLHRHGYR
jgi:PKD repeat protein